MTMIQKYMFEKYQKAMETKCVCRYAKTVAIEEARENCITVGIGRGCRNCWLLEAKGYEVDKEKWKEFVKMMLGGD